MIEFKWTKKQKKFVITGWLDYGLVGVAIAFGVAVLGGMTSLLQFRADLTPYLPALIAGPASATLTALLAISIYPAMIWLAALFYAGMASAYVPEKNPSKHSELSMVYNGRR